MQNQGHKYQLEVVPINTTKLNQWIACGKSSVLLSGRSTYISNLVISCLTKYQEAQSHSLQEFCDASTRGYAAVAHPVTRTKTDTIVRFVVVKARDAPLQARTALRLELLHVHTSSVQINCKCLGESGVYSPKDGAEVLHWLSSYTLLELQDKQTMEAICVE